MVTNEESLECAPAILKEIDGRAPPGVEPAA
jgi:hypothetical protein